MIPVPLSGRRPILPLLHCLGLVLVGRVLVLPSYVNFGSSDYTATTTGSKVAVEIGENTERG